MTEAVAESEQENIRRLYLAFNRRDIDVVLDRLAEDVRWANGMEGGHVEGRPAVREYWTRQFEKLRSEVVPGRISRADDGRVLVEVHQIVHSLDGDLLADEHVSHLFTFADGKITRFDIGD
jgi:ketosteroid isomerase-like protein